MDGSSSAIKGHIRINRKTFPDQFVMFTITDLVNNTDYQDITVAKIAGQNSFFTNNQDITVHLQELVILELLVQLVHQGHLAQQVVQDHLAQLVQQDRLVVQDLQALLVVQDLQAVQARR